jgi:hemolysin III
MPSRLTLHSTQRQRDGSRWEDNDDLRRPRLAETEVAVEGSPQAGVRRRLRRESVALLRRPLLARRPQPGAPLPDEVLRRLLHADQRREETANSLTHALGAVLSVAAAAVLLYFAVERGDPWRLAGCLLYAVPLVAVYTFSTLSHVVRGPRPRRAFRMLDQGAIYLLVAGTFTPLALAYLRHGWWWLLPAVIWTIALGGAFSKFVLAHRVDAVSTAVYLFLGWLATLSAPVMLQVMPPPAPLLMLLGGISYTLGVGFLLLDERYRYFHATWHLLVLAGSACHYAAILLCVLR